MMQSTASPYPCKEELQIKEEIIDVESTDNCFTNSSVDVDGGEVVTGNTLHNQRTASISTLMQLVTSELGLYLAAITQLTPYLLHLPHPDIPAAHVTPEVTDNTGFQLRVMTKGKVKHEKAPVPPAKEYGDDVNTTEGLKFTAHPEKELPKSKPVVADVNATPEHDNILETYFRRGHIYHWQKQRKYTRSMASQGMLPRHGFR